MFSAYKQKIIIMKNMIKVIVMLIVCFQFSNLHSETIRIPSHYTTIQLGIDAASNGDTVLVADGIYDNTSTTINFNGKAIVLVSENGPENCSIVLSGGQIFFASGETHSSVLSGFTITRADPSSAITCLNSSPLITNNIFRNNWVEGGVGTVDLYHSRAKFVNNVFYKNNGGGPCSGITCSDSTYTIVLNCTFFGSENYPLGWYFTGVLCDASSSAQIINCIFWNTGDNDFSNCTVTYSCLDKEIAGIGNVNVYPSFRDTTANDFSLLSNSVCIDSGTPDTIGLNLPYNDILGNQRIGGNGIDMGAFEYYNPEGVADEFAKSVIRAFPNPAKNQVTFQLPNIKYANGLKIFDIYGKMILDVPIKPNQEELIWNCSNASTGIYLYQIEIDNYIYSEKIIIN